MSQKLKGLKDGAEATVRDIRRRTRKQYSAEEKIRIARRRSPGSGRDD